MLCGGPQSLPPGVVGVSVTRLSSDTSVMSRCSRTAVEKQQRQPRYGDPRQQGHGCLRGARRQHELKERNRVAQRALQRAKRAVASPDNQRHTFDEECTDGQAEQSVSPPRKRTRPHVAEADEVHHCDEGVHDAEATSGTAKHRVRLSRHIVMVAASGSEATCRPIGRAGNPAETRALQTGVLAACRMLTGSAFASGGCARRS